MSIFHDNATDIFVDASPLGEPRLTGIGRYTARLALALSRRARVRFFAEEFELAVPSSLDWSHDQELRRWARRVWRARRVALRGETHLLGVYPCLRPLQRRFSTELSVLYDFTPLVVPATHTERTRRLFQRFYAQTLLSSDGALALSHATKFDASWLCDFPQERIAVCAPGPSLCVERHISAGPAARRPNVGLVVATLEPRKNARFLLDWFRDTAVVPAGTELWWVGGAGWLNPRVRWRSSKNPTRRRVRFLGSVSDRALCQLYRTASFSIFPSLYEGFGLPALDSLRHGVPVFLGYHSALREFADSPGVHYFDPCDPLTLDEAWRQFARERSLPPSVAELDERYNWARVAETVLRLGGVDTATRRGAVDSAA